MAINSHLKALFHPINSSSLALFRILLGFNLIYYVFYIITPENIILKYAVPQVFFSFSLFDWLHLKPLGSNGLYWLFMSMGISACTITLGVFTRLSILIFFLAQGYLFILEKAYYYNHHYLLLLILLLLLFSGSHRCASLDSLINPKKNCKQIPYWNLFILRAQISIVYFYSGVAKINPDFINGKILNILLLDKIYYNPAWEPLLTNSAVLQFLSIGALIIDLSIWFFLWKKNTRAFAFFVTIAFHLMNLWFFGIGIFHFLMLSTLVLFLEPEQPRDIYNKIIKFLRRKTNHQEVTTAVQSFPQWPIVFIITFLSIQLLVPLRHWLYPGDVSWTMEGQRFSWRLLANVRIAKWQFFVTDPASGKTKEVFHSDIIKITKVQYIMAKYYPDILIQFVQLIKNKYEQNGIDNPIVSAHASISVNKGEFHPFIDGSLNLAQVRYPPFSHAKWILPSPGK